jgi:hypothetical protein
MEHRQTGETPGATHLFSSLIRLAGWVLFADLLFAHEAVASLGPSGTRGFMVEVKTAVSTHATVACSRGFKGWLR